MKIAVNTRLLIYNKLEGIGWFTYETLKIITRQHPEVEFIFLFDRPFDKRFIFSDNITPVVLSPQARHPILFYAWFEFSVSRALKKYKPDVFLSPDGYLSLNTNTKQLAVIHDINFYHYPQDVPFLVRKYYNYFFPKFAHKASRIATVSEFSKNDIALQYNISTQLIDVVYNGVNPIFSPVDKETKEHVVHTYTFGCSYFIYVGSIHPRKNISRLLLAFDLFKTNTNSTVKLVLVGEKYYWPKNMQQVFNSLKHSSDIIFTGRLNTLELKKLLASALALVYVPYFEGFGIPLLEAMRCETPVITSNVTSLPEVARDAAKYVNPFSIDDIANAMIEMYSNESLRLELIHKGKIRQEAFSWNKTAELLWHSIQKTM